MPTNDRDYQLSLDGRLFAKQRFLVVLLQANHIKNDMTPTERSLLDGLTNGLDAIADQAHDQYGIDCLFHGMERDDLQETEADRQQLAHSDQPQAANPQDEEHWWICPKCRDAQDVCYGALAESGGPYCADCDEDMFYVGTRDEYAAWRAQHPGQAQDD